VSGAARKYGLVSALLCVAVTLTAAHQVDAQPTTSPWLSPASLSAVGEEALAPRVAFDAQGDAMALWERREGADNSVEAAFRPAGGAWQAPSSLGSCGESGCEPNVAFDGKGDAVAVWELYSGAHFNVEAAVKPTGGPWQTPVYLSADEYPGADHPQLAVDELGDAIAVWDRGLPGGGVVQAAFMPAGGAWQAPVDVAALGDEPQVAFDRQGDAVALWKHSDGSDYIVQAASKPAGGSWQAPVDVSDPGETAEGLQVAFDRQGDATAVWRRWANGPFSYHIVQSAFQPAGRAWQAPVNLIGAEDELDQPKNAGDPRLAVDRQGDAVAAWTWEFGGNIQAAFRPAGGAWRAPLNISAFGENATNPQVAFDAQGNAMAVWGLQPYIGAPEVIQSAFMPADGAWQTPVDISAEDASSPQVAFDGQGDAIAVWDSGNGTSNEILGAGYVATGPLLNCVAIPGEGTAGQPVSFAVAPLDVWSISGKTSWSFGDGTTASGTTATHTYTAAGTYEVTLHSADTLGNVTSTAGKITIKPAVTSAPPPSEPSPDAPTSDEPPMIGAVSQSASTWRESGKAPVGTTFSVSLNERATVKFSFARRVNGRTVGHRCLAMASKHNSGAVCRSTVIAGALSFVGHSGANKALFQGRVSHSQKLKPSHYTLVITATNAGGQHSSPKSLTFTIVE
jgi:PKD domain